MFRGPRGDEWFWKKIDVCDHRVDCDTCCWVWQGVRDKSGYGVTGRILESGKYEKYVHRIAWILVHRQEPPRNGEVAHTCDNPPCCNPRHLVLMTHIENIQDSVKKGRRLPNQLKGSQCKMAKLTEQDVLEVWRLWKEGTKQGDIARGKGISQAAISKILNRKAWKHVPIPC